MLLEWSFYVRRLIGCRLKKVLYLPRIQLPFPFCCLRKVSINLIFPGPSSNESSNGDDAESWTILDEDPDDLTSDLQESGTGPIPKIVQ